jgi:hypothetical protein
MSFELSRGRQAKGGIGTRLWGALENDFARNLMLAAALLVGIMALVEAFVASI